MANQHTAKKTGSKSEQRRRAAQAAPAEDRIGEVHEALTGLTEFFTGGAFAAQVTEAVKAAVPTPETPHAFTPAAPAATAAPEPTAQSAIEKAVAKSRANAVTVNDEWDAIAREVIGGEYIDHTEQENTRGGGILFTIQIKLEKSNMPKSYLDQVKCDRRTKDVTSEGLDGVIAWCRMVKQNLGRGKSINVMPQ